MFPGISHNIHKYYFYTFSKICARFKLKHPFSYLWWHKLTFRILPTIIRKIETMFINRTYQWHKIMTQLNFPNPYFIWIVRGLFNRASTCPMSFPISATQILASNRKHSLCWTRLWCDTWQTKLYTLLSNPASYLKFYWCSVICCKYRTDITLQCCWWMIDVETNLTNKQKSTFINSRLFIIFRAKQINLVVAQRAQQRREKWQQSRRLVQTKQKIRRKWQQHHRENRKENHDVSVKREIQN